MTDKNNKKGLSRVTRSEADLETGLLALVHEQGSAKRAAARCAALGVKISHETLRRWKESHADRIAEIRRERLPQIREEAAQRHDVLAEKNMSVHQQALDKLSGDIPKMEGKEVGRLVQPTAISAGIHRTKSAELRNEIPPSVGITINFAEQVRGMASKGTKFFDNDGNELTPEQVIAGKARQIPPAESAAQFSADEYRSPGADPPRDRRAAGTSGLGADGVLTRQVPRRPKHHRTQNRRPHFRGG
jgi:hypothetical protein